MATPTAKNIRTPPHACPSRSTWNRCHRGEPYHVHSDQPPPRHVASHSTWNVPSSTHSRVLVVPRGTEASGHGPGPTTRSGPPASRRCSTWNIVLGGSPIRVPSGTTGRHDPFTFHVERPPTTQVRTTRPGSQWFGVGHTTSRTQRGRKHEIPARRHDSVTSSARGYALWRSWKRPEACVRSARAMSRGGGPAGRPFAAHCVPRRNPNA